jgi:acetoin utilization deacetylase AcuC-like enzyme
MKKIYRVALATHPLCLAHDPGIGQPENPFRLQAILQALSSSGYAYEQGDVPLALDSIQQTHGATYLRRIEKARGKTMALDTLKETYTSVSSIDAAYMAASVGCSVVERILTGEIDRGFALLRPPGHHACAHKAMGYCIINNVAVAIAHAKKHGAKKIAILDFDVHHGNGTQDIVNGDPACLHIDFHQKELFPEYGGAISDVGTSPAKGHLVNIELPGGCAGKEYAHIMEEIVVPTLESFQPDIIFVSAGYDAHEYDGLSAIQLSHVDYYNMVSDVCRVAQKYCQGRVVCFLEGGYSVAALQSSVLATVAALYGKKCPNVPTYPPRPNKIVGFEKIVRRLKKQMKLYWKK